MSQFFKGIYIIEHTLYHVEQDYIGVSPFPSLQVRPHCKLTRKKWKYIHFLKAEIKCDSQVLLVNYNSQVIIIPCHIVNDFSGISVSAVLPLFIPQFSSVAQSCLTLCDPMDYSTPGFSSLLGNKICI